jgi:hypothetical protein
MNLLGAGTALRVLVAAALCIPVHGLCGEEEDLRADVIARCIYHGGEFGNDFVQICIEQDLAAATALAQYQRNAREIVGRCSREFQNDGWARVKICADRDIEAERTLAGYAEKDGPAVEECRTKVGKSGPAQVKACVDQLLKDKHP